MLINLIPNEEYKINKEVIIDCKENTLNIIDISPVKVEGLVYISHTTIEYDLMIETVVIIEDSNNHCTKKIELSFKIQESDEISQENLHINEKTLDLNAKIWENIVVEIFGESFDYEVNLTSGEGWTLYQEEQDNNEIDERLKPLLELLNSNEEV